MDPTVLGLVLIFVLYYNLKSIFVCTYLCTLQYLAGLICVHEYNLRSILILYFIYVSYCTWFRADLCPLLQPQNYPCFVLYWCTLLFLVLGWFVYFNETSRVSFFCTLFMYFIYVLYCTWIRADLCTLLCTYLCTLLSEYAHKKSWTRLSLSVPGLGLICVLEHHSRSISILRNIIYRGIVNLKFK